MTKLVSLTIWADRFTPKPHINTLRAWAKDGQIVPCPLMMGKTYYVPENARHIEEVIHHGPQTQT
jgi:hypothetical protein